MEAPRNCDECPYTNTCPAPHYGGDRCRYEKVIKNNTITETLKGGGNHELYKN